MAHSVHKVMHRRLGRIISWSHTILCLDCPSVISMGTDLSAAPDMMCMGQLSPRTEPKHRGHSLHYGTFFIEFPLSYPLQPYRAHPGPWNFALTTRGAIKRESSILHSTKSYPTSPWLLNEMDVIAEIRKATMELGNPIAQLDERPPREYNSIG
jgi:hypothetical protein